MTDAPTTLDGLEELLQRAICAPDDPDTCKAPFCQCNSHLRHEVRAALSALAERGLVIVPAEGVHEQISAMACSRARDDEGEFDLLLDLIDFSGENKTRTVLREAYRRAVAASPFRLETDR